MSKKKNTLKDLDEFLKQQAATLVSPTRVPEAPQDTSQVLASNEENTTKQEVSEPSFYSVIHDLKTLAARDKEGFRKQFYNLIIGITESSDQSLPEDKMLINTALYLIHGEGWKEAIRKYWKEKK